VRTTDDVVAYLTLDYCVRSDVCFVGNPPARLPSAVLNIHGLVSYRHIFHVSWNPFREFQTACFACFGALCLLLRGCGGIFLVHRLDQA